MIADNEQDRPRTVGVDAAEPTDGPCVLVAEDDPEMCRLIAAALRRAGYRVVELKDGNELFAYMRLSLRRDSTIEQPSLIISDVRMPGWSGLEVLSALRRVNWTTKVILITAFGDDETHAKARILGAAALFDKPFDLKELYSFVQKLVPAAARTDDSSA